MGESKKLSLKDHSKYRYCDKGIRKSTTSRLFLFQLFYGELSEALQTFTSFRPKIWEILQAEKLGNATLEQKLNLGPQKRKREPQMIMLTYRALTELQFDVKNSFLR